MEETKALIEQLSSKFDNKSLKETVTRINHELLQAEMEHKTRIEATEDTISQVKRKNKQIESEVERLILLQGKNAAQFNKKNTERIRISKKIIELEQENEELEMTTNRFIEEIERLENETRILCHPTVEELYYEIVKGFGVDFCEEDGNTNARIRNKNRNDIFMVECTENVQETCENIWNCIEF